MNMAQIASQNTSDRRVLRFSDIPRPHDVLSECPLGARRADRVARDRDESADILAGRDDRLLVVVGPCSGHDPAAA
ncbi:3-deoxy-7-phosphoheptulonate synthase, partial [Enterococcus faecium]